MLTSYPVACPYEGCGWRGSLVPSLVQGGASGEVARMQRAWLHCPGCGRDWEVRMVKDEAEVLPAARAGHVPPDRKVTAPLAGVQATHACRACGAVSDTA